MPEPKRPMGVRAALAEEAKRRRMEGESPAAICEALKIGPSTYSRWARLLGFRAVDIDPDDPGARGKGPPGATEASANWTGSGRYMRREGLGRPKSGGRVAGAALLPEGVDGAEVLKRVERAMETGQESAADAILKELAARARREKQVGALRAAAEAQARDRGKVGRQKPVDEMSEDELRFDLARLLGTLPEGAVYQPGWQALYEGDHGEVRPEALLPPDPLSPREEMSETELRDELGRILGIETA